MWEMIQAWIQINWIPITITIVAGYLALKFGVVILQNIIRRSVRYRAHGDVSDEDVKKRQDTLLSMFTAVFRVMVWLTVIFTILGRFGFDLAPLLAATGVLGLAVGFGAQSLIKDFISGLFIILENQYRVGDVVELDGAGGTVEQINIRTTIVRDNDGSVHYIPNGIVTHAINKTMGFAKINLAIAVKPQTDVDKMADIINQIGNDLAVDEKWAKKIIDAPHFLSIGSFSDTALEVKIIGKVQPSAQWGVTGELRKRLLSALKTHKIELANLPANAAVGKRK